MAFKECSEEERIVIAQGAVMFGSWADGKPLQMVLACAMSLVTRVAARIGIDETDFIDYARRNLRDAVKSRQLQQAVGPFTATILDGERRVLLPREAGESDPL